MASYAEWRVCKLAAGMEAVGVEPAVREAVLAGGERLTNESPVADKMAWLEEAMGRLTELLDEPTWRRVRESKPCCLGGKRHQMARAIYKENATLAERVAAANAAPYVFGHSVEQLDEGRFRVTFHPPDGAPFGCGCFPKATQTLPLAYCYCCGGHVKHHLRTALGLKLTVEAKSSALASGGAEPCVFELSTIGG